MNWLSKFFKFREQRDDGDVIKPFLEHMEDLRWTLIKMLLALIAGMVIAFFFRNDLMHIVQAPLDAVDPNMRIEMISLELAEGFMISLKLAFYAGVLLCFPLLLWFAAEFVLPALTRRERRMLLPAILVGFLLFGAGVVASYHMILPKTVQWFANYSASMGLKVTLQAGKYFSFVTHLLLACGLLCEMPVVVLGLSGLGIVSYRLLSATRPYAVTLILILVALIAPTPDPFTFVAMAMPVVAIYEGCIWLVWGIERRKRKKELSPQTIPE